MFSIIDSMSIILDIDAVSSIFYTVAKILIFALHSLEMASMALDKASLP